MTQLVTMNVSVEQIERDLRAGKSVGEIAQDWSEPAANVYAVKRAMDAAAARPPSTPVRSVAVAAHNPPPARVPATADAGVTALVLEASQSKAPRTRALGAKLDKLVEELQERLTAERAEAAEREEKRREQEAAVAEVARLEEQLRAARAKLGGKSKRTSTTKTADNPSGGKSKRAAYDGGPPPSVIREWALGNSVDCPAHGMLPQRVVAAYRSAVGDE